MFYIHSNYLFGTKQFTLIEEFCTFVAKAFLVNVSTKLIITSKLFEKLFNTVFGNLFLYSKKSYLIYLHFIFLIE